MWESNTLFASFWGFGGCSDRPQADEPSTTAGRLRDASKALRGWASMEAAAFRDASATRMAALDERAEELRAELGDAGDADTPGEVRLMLDDLRLRRKQLRRLFADLEVARGDSAGQARRLLLEAMDDWRKRIAAVRDAMTQQA